MKNTLRVARAALHFWEEPCISGEEGSGAVFFTGCNLRCVFCQNFQIARAEQGKEITIERLADIFLELQEQMANNINLVTATHYVPQVVEALKLAKERGLCIPVVYNCGGYETVDTLNNRRKNQPLADFMSQENVAGADEEAGLPKALIAVMAVALLVVAAAGVWLVRRRRVGN